MNTRFDRRAPGPISRRKFLAGAGLFVAMVLQACGRSRQAGEPETAAPAGEPQAPAGGDPLAPTPACGDGATEAQTEGPFFSTNSPERTNFQGDVTNGTKMVLSGAVLSTACVPVAGAKIELWHADGDGEYDNSGFKLRGHFFTDGQGRYQVATIEPGNYPGRTRHFHVKVQPEGGRVLTTQLYFPDEPANSRDGIFDPDLLMKVGASGGEITASFDFVLQV